MKQVDELKKELVLLLKSFKENEITLDIALIKFERIFKDFQLLSNSDNRVLYVLMNNFKDALLKIEKSNIIKEELQNNSNCNYLLRNELGLQAD